MEELTIAEIIKVDSLITANVYRYDGKAFTGKETTKTGWAILHFEKGKKHTVSQSYKHRLSSSYMYYNENGKFISMRDIKGRINKRIAYTPDGKKSKIKFTKEDTPKK